MTAAETLNFVFACAISDRQTLADGCSKDDPMRKEALTDIRRFRALRDRLIPKRTPASMIEWLEAHQGPFEVVCPTTPEGKARLKEIQENP